MEWPPVRFRQLLEGEVVICAAKNCGLPIILDPAMFSFTRAMVKEWHRNHDNEPVPPRLLRLAANCLNGHSEVSHAEPVVTREAAQALAEAEEARYQGALTGKRCTSCGERYHGNKYSRYCSECRVAAS